MKKKAIIAITAVVLVLCCAVAGTIAWLTDVTGPVTNTFTYGNIDIDLTESANLDLKMIPGKTITKDPKVTVKAKSEACWLFVKVEKSANFDDFMAYTIADGWTALDGHTGVYYREVSASTADQDYYVIKDNHVTVSDKVTKAMFDEIKDGKAKNPTLTFTAYAVQKDNVASAADAWAKVSA